MQREVPVAYMPPGGLIGPNLFKPNRIFVFYWSDQELRKKSKLGRHINCVFPQSLFFCSPRKLHRARETAIKDKCILTKKAI